MKKIPDERREYHIKAHVISLCKKRAMFKPDDFFRILNDHQLVRLATPYSEEELRVVIKQGKAQFYKTNLSGYQKKWREGCRK